MKFQKYKVIVVALSLMAGFASCTGDSGKKETDAKENKESTEGEKQKPDGLELTTEQMQTVGILTGPIAQKKPGFCD